MGLRGKLTWSDASLVGRQRLAIRAPPRRPPQQPTVPQDDANFPHFTDTTKTFDLKIGLLVSSHGASDEKDHTI